MRYLWIK